MSTANSTSPQTIGQPTWDVALLFPDQGEWTEGDFCALKTSRLVEFNDGNLEVLPLPTEEHQSIVAYLYGVISAFVTAGKLGKVLFAPLRLRVRDGKFREPDILFLLERHADRRGSPYWTGADLVVEVVSPNDPDRDWKTKRREYAEAGISEYWIVDPSDRSITLLALDDAKHEYDEVCRNNAGELVHSRMLEGLTIDVEQTFAAADHWSGWHACVIARSQRSAATRAVAAGSSPVTTMGALDAYGPGAAAVIQFILEFAFGEVEDAADAATLSQEPGDGKDDDPECQQENQVEHRRPLELLNSQGASYAFPRGSRKLRMFRWITPPAAHRPV